MHSSTVRRVLLGSVALLAGVILLLVGMGLALDAGCWREPLTHFLAAQAGRPLRVDGALQVRILSLHPQLHAERVIVGNPPWMPHGAEAELGSVTVVFTPPWPGRSIGIHTLEIRSARFHFLRDSSGRANWQWSPPGTRRGGTLPIVRSLSVSDSQVDLDDQRLHLEFHGTVAVQEVGATGPARPLRIDGAGELNGHSATLRIDGEPLATATHAAPYHFTFAGHSSGSSLTGSGFLSRPFDVTLLDADFDAAGANLADLYFLTGVTLVDTGVYRLSGKVARRGGLSTFTELAIATGQSDLRGSLSIDTGRGRPSFDADLNSQFLRLADIGAQAAGLPPEAGTALLLSAARFKPAAIRHSDGVLRFHAGQVELGHQALQSVAAQLRIDRGVLVVAPTTATVLDGKLTAQVRIDARTDDPGVGLDLGITGLQLGRINPKNSSQPPMQGLLRIRVQVQGHGTSLHEAAAGADGTVTAVLPTGALRDSLAELTGMDLRGAGLLLTHDARETAVHCGVASFRARAGTLTAESLVIDTDAVLITGDGSIHLDTEALDLALRGHPKGVRFLRLRAPVLVRGTLAHPSVGIQPRSAVAQTGAVALGVLLMPLAPILAFVDPDLAKNADCEALMAAANAAPRRP